MIGPDGKQIGVIPTREALTMAKNAGLDLLEVSPTARPPVCRILDFGKYMYDLSKKTKENKNSSQKLKEVKFRVNVAEHDYMTKLRHAESFLGKGNKVKFTLMFRGREMEHTELGFEIINRGIVDLEHIATADSKPRLAGRNIGVTLSPLPAQRRKLKYNAELSEDEHDDHDEEEDDRNDEDED